VNNREEAVRKMAYYMWEQDGRPVGQALHYWLRAEARLQAEQQAEGLHQPVPAGVESAGPESSRHVRTTRSTQKRAR
jgi:hypothetical protein